MEREARCEFGMPLVPCEGGGAPRKLAHLRRESGLSKILSHALADLPVF
jgi:hypothetical protein